MNRQAAIVRFAATTRGGAMQIEIVEEGQRAKLLADN